MVFLWFDSFILFSLTAHSFFSIFFSVMRLHYVSVCMEIELIVEILALVLQSWKWMDEYAVRSSLMKIKTFKEVCICLRVRELSADLKAVHVLLTKNDAIKLKTAPWWISLTHHVHLINPYITFLFYLFICKQL